MNRCSKLSSFQSGTLKRVLDNPKSSKNEFRRAQSILLLDEKKTSLDKIIQITRYGRRQIFRLRECYLQSGLKAIEDKRKGKPKYLLTKRQLKETKTNLITKTPKDFGYDCPFWTTGILGNLIEREYAVKYKSKTSLYLIFREAKFTYHKPGRVYHNQDPEEVRSMAKRNPANHQNSFQR